MPIINFDCWSTSNTFRTLEEAEAKAKARCEAEHGVWVGTSTSYQNDLTVFLWHTHVGLCVRDREMNGYDDSDFYMTVYSPEKDTFEEICFASTRGWSYPSYGSRPDATPEVMAKWDAHCQAIRDAAERRRAAAEAARPCRGKVLKVVRGRKVAIGTTGECIWIGDGRFGTRVGIKDATGSVHWTAVTNVEVVHA